MLDLGLSAGRPVAILSDNDLENITLAFGALWAGVPYLPVSAAYTLLSSDHAKPRHIVGLPCPGRRGAAGAGRYRADREDRDPLSRGDAWRKLAALDERATVEQVLDHPALHAFFQGMVDRLGAVGTGSANRVVLTHRAALMAALYDDRGALHVYRPKR